MFIPVVIDAERVVDGEEMVRVTYFAVTTDAPAAVWEVELPDRGAAPRDRSARSRRCHLRRYLREVGNRGADAVEFDLFTDADDVAAIFALEESGTPLTVQVEDVWMPRSWFDDEPVRGDVYRVALEVFQAAYRYTAGTVGPDLLHRVRREGAGDQLAGGDRGHDPVVAGPDRGHQEGLPRQRGQAEVERRWLSWR